MAFTPVKNDMIGNIKVRLSKRLPRGIIHKITISLLMYLL